MAVTEDDVRHIASLARLGIDEPRLSSLVGELNGILRHMEELRAVGSGEEAMDGTEAAPSPLRADEGPQLPLARARDDFAPEMRDGFFLVPRLASHEDAGERTP